MKFLFFILLAAAFYFLPTIIAYARRHNRRLLIAKINLTLGWTVIIWILLLIWVTRGRMEDLVWILLRRIRIR
ncbi:putative integral membrane protein [Desulfotomaculum nigrificans CO-1-SRB]|uniref:Putative integral membrane protein n=1 Tax=Desulfotomaculum nigrificans (strain DSM 14880 / VKM B-2319 / CO-1-SRB) TaxID=868595 RepID=F6BA06_DESCC|nr:superinfection immunity protein [Desulfotomaculum nigrificans]AEF94975.1 putative integral membrane protein [Desulfotomaculum nigrificans CO-1-SRB]